MNSNIKINPIQNSRIDSVDFNNLPFGKVFSDHMFVCDYKDGKWQNPTIEAYGPIELNPSEAKYIIFPFGCI